MQDRIKMNTESLQKEFPDVYQDFFVNHDLVVSGCFTLPWTPSGIGNRLDHISIRSKLPVKLYLGLKKVAKKEIHLGKVLSFDIINSEFIENKIIDINKEASKLINFIESILEKKELEFGLEISVLSEVSRGHGFGFSGVFASTLSIGLYLLTNDLDKEDLYEYNSFILKNIFKDISLLSWDIVCILKNKNTTLSNSLNVLSDFRNPTFFSCEKINGEYDLRNTNYHFYDIKDKFGSNLVNSEMPLDYCIVYSGLPSEAHRVIELSKFDIKKYNFYESFWDKIISSIDGSKLNSSKFLEKNSMYNHLNDNSIILSIKLTKLLVDIYEVGYDTRLVEELIDNVNGFGAVLALIEKKSNFIKEFEYFFRKNKSIYDEKIGIMPIYSGKIGGGYLIVTKQFQSRETINKSIKYMLNQYPHSRLEYASWLDGESSDGIKLEQFASEEIYSEYFDKNQLILYTNSGKKILGEHEELINKMGNGLLIDTINRKIFVNGKKLTSKDIPSQATTVEVLSILLENKGKEVSNNMFEVSSYSKNKNDMIGKIVIPLVKLTEKYFSKKIELICKGSLIEFKMLLTEEDINIGIIKKI